MFLIKNIGDSFDDLGYPELDQLENYLANLNIVNFSKLIGWLSSNLNQTSNIESTVNAIENEEEADSFKIELSSLLKELGSPHTIDQIEDLTNKLTILNYLCGELLASSIEFVRKSNVPNREFDESEIAKQLRLILMNFSINKPSPNDKIEKVFEKITQCVDDEFKKRNIIIEESLLFKKIKKDEITPNIWAKLDEINEQLKQEYEIRKRTLITRSDCTITSFKFGRENEDDSELESKISELYAKFNYLLERHINIDISDLMAIKQTDFNQLNNTAISKSHQLCAIIPLKNSKLANQGLQQKLSLHKFLIGNVPDRGGRTEETIKPEQETFSQQQQQREKQQNFNKNQNNRNFNQQNNQKQNFNLNPNKVQGSGWNQQQYHDNNYNRNFSGQSGDNYYGNNANNKFNQRFDQQQNQYGQQNQQRSGRGGYQGGNRSDSYRGGRRGRGY